VRDRTLVGRPTHQGRLTVHDAAIPDSDLLELARQGDTDAYADLYRRHHNAVLAMAVVTVGRARAEDVAAEAFARTLKLLRRGAGPTDTLRPYLLAAVRNGGVSDHRATGRVTPVAEVSQVLDARASSPQPDSHDHLDGLLVRRAFRSLPERWREVLWLGLVEDRPTTEVAARLGLSPQATAQLASRAREALRVAYLEQHVAAPADGECGRITAELAKYVRGTSVARRRRVARHLDGCGPCRHTTTELEQLIA
jgi:RNA polymerase sigma factor (sigma-70 family)